MKLGGRCSSAMNARPKANTHHQSVIHGQCRRVASGKNRLHDAQSATRSGGIQAHPSLSQIKDPNCSHSGASNCAIADRRRERAAPSRPFAKNSSDLGTLAGARALHQGGPKCAGTMACLAAEANTAHGGSGHSDPVAAVVDHRTEARCTTSNRSGIRSTDSYGLSLCIA